MLPPFNPVTSQTVTTFQTPRGVFAPAISGNFNPSTGIFMPSLAGSSVLTSRGVFRPNDGRFVASPTGNLVLSTRETFNPRTGRFEPSPTGPFVFSTQGNLISSTTGNRTPVSLRGLGQLNPLNPFSPFNPVNQANYASLAYFNALLNNASWGGGNPYGVNPYGMNPYSPLAYGYNPAAYGSYGSSSYMPSPYSYGGSGYGSPYGGSSYGAPSSTPDPTASIPPYTPYDIASKQQPVAASYGLPNENGKTTWPLAFRLMPPDKKHDLLDKFEAQMKVVSEQGAAGKTNPVVLNEARRSIEGLQNWLKSRRADLAEGTFRDADTLLKNIDKTLRTMSN
jgi:hypothetical protein